MYITKSRIKEVVFTVFCILFTALIYYRDFAVVDFNKIFLVLITFVTAAVLDYKYIIYMLCFLFPLSCGIPGNYIYPLLIILLLFKDKKTNFNKWGFFIVIFLMEILHYGFYIFEIQFAEVLGYMSYVFLMSYIIADNSEDIDYSKCLIIFCVGICVLLLGLVINTSILTSQMASVDEGLRLGNSKRLGDYQDTRMMLSTNANNVGYYSIAAISCLLVLQYYRKISSFLFLALFALAFYGGVLSVSRTWALLMVLSIVIYMFLMKKDRIKGLLLIAVLCICVFVFLSNNSLILGFFTDRFIGDSTNLATGGGRTILFQQYNDFLANNPISLLLGTGAIYYMEVTQIEGATHNAVQQIIVSYGLLGLGIFICAFVRSINKHFNKKELMSILPLCVIIIFVQSIQVLNPYFLMCPIIVAFFAIKMGKLQSKKV